MVLRPISLVVEHETYLPPSVVQTRRKIRDWKLTPSQKGAILTAIFFPTSAFFKLDKYDSEAYLNEENR